jgi:hypothetical protein
MDSMPWNRHAFETIFLLIAALTAGAVLPAFAAAQSPQPQSEPPESSSHQVMTRPVAPDAGAMSKADQPDGIVPSGGVELYQRMGAGLPPAPAEKPYTGPVDEAFGAYQRGLYVTALSKALQRASAGDAAAQTLVAEMMTKGLGIKRDAKTAAFWYGQAAERGDPAGMFQYALLLMTGRDVPAD